MGITARKQPIETKNTRHKEVSLLAKIRCDVEEEVQLPQKGRNLGDRKCLGDPRKSLVGLPNAISFCQFRRGEFFNSTPVSDNHPFGA
jgi:hypothetical protein